MVLVYPSSTSTVNGIFNTQSLDQRLCTNLLSFWEEKSNGIPIHDHLPYLSDSYGHSYNKLTPLNPSDRLYIGLESPFLAGAPLHRHRDFEKFDQFVLADPQHAPS